MTAITPQKPGRPRKSRPSETISLRLPDDLLRRMDDMAKKLGSRTEVIKYLFSKVDEQETSQLT